MASAQVQKPPAWQTDELQDEWPDSDPEDGGDNEANNLSYGTQSVSLTIPLSTQIHSTADYDADHTHASSRSRPVGTFLVREDAAHINLMPKTPGQNKKGLMKNIFTPTPLERMFDPPSPPIPSTSEAKPWDPSPPSHSMATPNNNQPEQVSDEIMETDMPNMNSFHGRKASMACQFTFAMPRESLSRTSGAGGAVYPQAQSTPNPPFAPTSTAPLTDPRLRLFQFQYDTYTREHLSALVDSIAVNTPSGTGTTGTPTSFTNGLSRVSEVTGTADNVSHLRSSKRIKLSPSSDLCGDGVGVRATITRPKLYGKDYVGESHSLMQKIKQARDYSTISTVASGQDQTPSTKNDTPSTTRSDLNNKFHERRSKHNASPSEPSRRPSFLSVPEQTSNPSASSGTVATKPSPYSSSSYRQKAAALMEQIKSDVKSQKRVFSGDSEATALPEDTTNTFSSRTGSVKLGTDAKESLRQSHSRRTSTSSKSNVSRSRASPRRSHKNLADESDLVHNLSRISIHEQHQPQQQQAIVNVTLVPPAPNPSLAANTRPEREHPQTARPNLAPPSHPSIRLTTNEDLNRFVSSSTASGTTITAGSAPSFVKHAGPAHIRTIAPSDIPPLPERFGDMLFDKVMMRWVKSTAGAVMDPETAGHATESSEDPFGDIESLRSDSDSRGEEEEEEGDVEGEEGEEEESETERLRDTSPGPAEMMSRISEHSEVEDEEEMELSNFSTDVSAHIVHVMTGVETDGYDDDETTDSGDEDDIHTVTRPQDIKDINFDSEFEDSPSRNNSVVHVSGHPHAGARGTPQFLAPPLPSTVAASPRANANLHTSPNAIASSSALVLATPSRGNSIGSTTPIIKSALKSTSATPTSALRNPNRSRYTTPLNGKSHQRSVSFSDGKREGPIQGITASGGGSTSIVQSARTKRIADMMHALEDSDLDEDDSPSKTSSSGRPEELQPLSHRRPSGASGPSSGKPKSPAKSKSSESPRRVFSRSYTHRPSSISPASAAGQRSFSRANASANKANATFLTECSFGVAHDRLVEVITDVQPFEPHWEELGSIDLSGAKLESVARLKEFLPRLDSLCLNRNELAWLSGIPAGVRTLSVANNCLTGITSYSHLLNLENLDISHNEVDSLRQLECLRHLRELKADGNKIASADGLQRMDGLVKLSLQGNAIKAIDLKEYRWSRLEMLNLSHNRIDSLQGLASLQSLIALNLDSNALSTLSLPTGVHLPRLRILRLSNNRLTQLDVGSMPHLRTLYADNNALSGITQLGRLNKLENLSVRNQAGRGFKLLTRDVRDVKRLYLSGNPLKSDFLQEPCYNLVYLEVAACRLTGLPSGEGGMGRLVPNLRVLNLNYNFLEDVRALEGLTRLQKLTIIGSRLKKTKPLIRLVQQMPDVEMLDFRMNPCTLGWYLPLLVRDVPGALQPSSSAEGRAGWQELDSKFRRDLPDDAYIGRLAYRGLVMRGCARVRVVDGVAVTEKERTKAEALLAGIGLG